MKLNHAMLTDTYKIIEEETVPEIGSDAIVYEHIKTKAKVIYVKNDDDNRVFYIAFKTPPSDHTGVFHILEHSVLCGSKKYPLKEPFIELAKGSLNTFLNAMTYPDKTVYPVASRNLVDFKNLVDVYLDAVLHPNIYSNKSIFHQEGWHFDLQDTESKLCIQGIVYNEMKGAYSSPDQLLLDAITRNLFPDTVYRYDSGGKPDHIPQLSYEQFIHDHQKYYHPSNCYIYLYGDLNINEWLQYIDQEYLCHYEFHEVDVPIPFQASFPKSVANCISYPIGSDDDDTNKAWLSLSFVAGLATDPLHYLSMGILEHILLGTPASPLKKALIDADIAEEIRGFTDLNMQQTVFGIIAKNARPELHDRFLEIIRTTLSNLVLHGIDQELVQSAINIHEFHLREADYHGFPKGLIYGLNIMDSWIYGGKATAHLSYEKTMQTIRSQSREGYFEKMIQDLLVNNPHCADLILQPCKGMEERHEMEWSSAMENRQRNATPDELSTWIEEGRQLKKMQETPDTEIGLNAIPLLKLKDIAPQSEKLPLEEATNKNYTLLFHPLATQNIMYLNMYFDISTISLDELPYVNILSNLLSKMATKKYRYEDLSNQLCMHTGGLSFDAMIVNDYNDINSFSRLFAVQGKALTSSYSKLLDLFQEIALSTDLSDPRRIHELIAELRSSCESAIYHQGHLLAGKRLNSYFSPAGLWSEKLSGLSFYHFLLQHDPIWSKNPEVLISKLQSISSKIFRTQNLKLSLASSSDDIAKCRTLTENMVSIFPCEHNDAIHEIPFTENIKNEGIMTSGKVQYVSKGYNFKRLGFPYHGTMQVVETLSSLDYLWNRIRVMGGAYGAYMKVSRNGRLILGSYRDPHLSSTITTFNELGNYLSLIDLNERELRKYIIGTMSQLDAPLTPSMKAYKSDIYYISKTSQDMIQQERDEILATTLKEIRQMGDYITACTDKNCLCVMGGEKRLKENSELFGALVKAFQ